ncbi:hypothetical protein [Tenacibaculum finnmarkense]|nr:hypothetical protein [Tenacibaculum finnmarkense]MCD8426700.1 hypothetical protein [Tenacibaculum finnmarkense genomovar finnmarkense]MCG8776491.1 hypothetical protein [Tenacibaculum finnmarkense]
MTNNSSQINKIWDNTNLLYQSITERSTKDGEIRTKEVRTYKNLVFIKYYNRLEIVGSVHYFYNNGLHNANRFTVLSCINVLNELINTFNITPKEFKVIGLEYGVNIQTKEDVNYILDCLRFFGKLRITESQQYKNFYTAGTTYKSLKIYNKTQDCKKHALQNTLRFEAKARKSQVLQKLDIYTLEDLLEPVTYLRLADSLFLQWEKILLFDFKLTGFEKEHQTEFWLDAMKHKDRNKFSNEKKKYLQKLPKESLYFTLKNQLETELKEILKYADLPLVKRVKNNKKKQLIKVLKNVKNMQIDSSTKYHYAYLENQLKNSPRICLITGVNISMQKEDSFLLSHTGLKYLLKTDFSQFEKIRNKFIYPKYRFLDIEIQIKEIAHSIRDKNVIRKRNYNNNQTSIF